MSLKERYETEILPQLKKELGANNRFEVPAFEKVVVNIGLGDSATNSKLLDSAIKELTLIVGQKPLVTRAKKSIAGFKVREGMPVGITVTLRGKRMYDFIAKLVDLVLPRIRDFKGVSENAFDGRGNYNIGLKDQLVFPEIQYDQVLRVRGMNITLVTSARTDADAKALLTAIGFPFRKAAVKSVTQQAKAAA